MKTPKSLFRAVLSALAALLLGAQIGRTQSCINYDIITTHRTSSTNKAGYGPFAPDYMSPKIFAAYSVSNFVHNIDNFYTSVGELHGTNNRSSIMFYEYGLGQTGGSGTNQYDEVSSAGNYSNTNIYSWPGGWSSGCCFFNLTQGFSGQAPNYTETTWTESHADWWSGMLSGSTQTSTIDFSGTIEKVLSAPLSKATFAASIPLPSGSPTVKTNSGSSFVGPLFSGRLVNWDPGTGSIPYGEIRSASFEGTIVEMTGAVQFNTETNKDYEVSWIETSATGGTSLRRMSVPGTGGTVTVTFFDPGTPETVGTIEASGLSVTELGAEACGTCSLEEYARAPGGPGPDVRSARFRMDLGKSGHKRSAGYLGFHEMRPLSDLATPHRLSYVGSTNSVTLIAG